MDEDGRLVEDGGRSLARRQVGYVAQPEDVCVFIVLESVFVDIYPAISSSYLARADKLRRGLGGNKVQEIEIHIHIAIISLESRNTIVLVNLRQDVLEVGLHAFAEGCLSDFFVIFLDRREEDWRRSVEVEIRFITNTVSSECLLRQE